MTNTTEFRIWDNQLKKFDYDLFLNMGGKPCRHVIYDVIPGDTRKPAVCELRSDRFEVSRYIGRSDVNGVRAFTGDIIKNAADQEVISQTWEICFSNPLTRFLMKTPLGFETVLPETFKIIGNKWEGLFSDKKQQAESDFYYPGLGLRKQHNEEVEKALQSISKPPQGHISDKKENAATRMEGIKKHEGYPGENILVPAEEQVNDGSGDSTVEIQGNDGACPGCGFTGRHSAICPCDTPEKWKKWIRDSALNIKRPILSFIQTEKELLFSQYENNDVIENAGEVFPNLTEVGKVTITMPPPPPVPCNTYIVTVGERKTRRVYQSVSGWFIDNYSIHGNFLGLAKIKVENALELIKQSEAK